MDDQDTPFGGFNSSETFSLLPDSLFNNLHTIRDIAELKLILYILWRIGRSESRLKLITRNEIALDLEFCKNFASVAEIDTGLAKAVKDGFLLTIQRDSRTFFFPNSPGGIISLNSVRDGQAVPEHNLPAAAATPNIHSLYEQNIGMLTPIISQLLLEMEASYPPAWIADAMGVAVKMNKRNLKYIEAILRRWKEEGRGENPAGQNAKESNSGDDTRRKLEQFLNPKPRK